MKRTCLVLALLALVACGRSEKPAPAAGTQPPAAGKPLTAAQQKFLARFTWDQGDPAGDLQGDGTACNTGEPEPSATPAQNLIQVKRFIDCMADRGWRYVPQ